MLTATVLGEQFKGHRDGLISVLEARGYQALRNEQNPHPYFQASEHLKRAAHDKAR